MRLEVDIGNTRLKYRLTGGQTVGIASDQWAAHAAGLPDSVDQIAVAAVVGSATCARFSRVCRQRWGLDPSYLTVRNGVGGLQLDYRPMESLGIDRWLGMLGGRRHFPNRSLLIVLAGTALVLDTIDAEGRHLGGYICPGLGLQTRALSRAAAGLQPVALPLGHLPPNPGRATDECLRAGMSLQLAGLLREVLARMVAQHPVTLVVSGGDAESLLSVPLPPVVVERHHCPSLVLDGMALAL